MEVAELVDPGVRHVLVGVVHHRRALEVAGRQDLALEVERAPAELALGVAEVAVQRPGVDDRDVAGRVHGVEEVGAEPYLDPGVVGHALQPGRVAVHRQALVAVGEVAVVEGVPHRQPGDDLGGQLARVGLPLLGGVAADERLVERPADQRDRLLLQVARGCGRPRRPARRSAARASSGDIARPK